MYHVKSRDKDTKNFSLVPTVVLLLLFHVKLFSKNKQHVSIINFLPFSFLVFSLEVHISGVFFHTHTLTLVTLLLQNLLFALHNHKSILLALFFHSLNLRPVYGCLQYEHLKAFFHGATAKAFLSVHLETGEKAPERKKPAKQLPKSCYLL